MAKNKRDRLRAEGLMQLGAIERGQSNVEAARACYEEAWELYSGLDDEVGKAAVLQSMADLYLQNGMYRRALAEYERSRDIYMSIGEHDRADYILGSMAVSYQNLGQHAKAIDHYERVIDYCQQRENRMLESIFLANLALLYQEQGRYDEALATYKKAQDLQRVLEDRRGEGMILGNLGIIYHRQQNWDKALTCYEKALQIHQEIGHKKAASINQGNLGELLVDQGKRQRGIDTLRSAIDNCTTVYPVAEGVFQGKLALILAVDGELVEALELLRKGEPLVRDHLAEYAKFLCNKGRVEVLANDRSLANQSLTQAQELAKQLQMQTASELMQDIAKLQRMLHES